MSANSKESSLSYGFAVLSTVTKGVMMLARPIVSLKETLIPPPEKEKGKNSMATSIEEESEPMTLEGTLYYRKGGRGTRTKPFSWKRRYIVLDMADGGSVSVYKVKGKNRKNMLRQMYTTLNMDNTERTASAPSREEDVCLYFPCDVPWIVKDACMDSRMFCIEIPTSDDEMLFFDDYEQEDGDEASELSSTVGVDPEDQMSSQPNPMGNPMEQCPTPRPPLEEDARSSLLPLPEESLVMGETERESQLADELFDDIMEAQRRSKMRLRFYFRCVRGGNEKALWLRAFAKIERMCADSSRKGMVMGSLTKIIAGNTRIRSATSASFARETLLLDRMFNSQMSDKEEVDVPETPSGKEFRVVPYYAYPHRWMTSTELREEMILPSARFHDLRVPSKLGQEIGSLRVEVLQGLGLPKLDRVSETDAVVYLVCGSYAFTTDVINDCASPMWLRKTRRACIFPIFHAYARLYVGVFDHDGQKSKDDLAGRVVLDLARLRPGCTYDVTLPLRMSTHVYSRRKRGSIRLRFQLDWKNERAALLSYIPKKLPNPKNLKPYDDVTVICCDEKATRNVAITVHGAHLPGRFSPKHFKAMLREINFTRKLVIRQLRTTIKDIIVWRNAPISFFVFVAWMHCIYKNQFSLAPAYFIVYLLIVMMRNYAKYGMDGPSQRGFVPVSFEEMLSALLTGSQGNSSCFQPLEMDSVVPLAPTISARSVMEMYSDGGVESEYKTHEPWGKTELRMLGFLPSEEALKRTNVEEEHEEFPFANGKDYPRFTVQEAWVERTSKSKSKRLASADPRSFLTESSSKLWKGHSRYTSESVGPIDGMSFEEEAERDIPRTGSGEMMEEVFDTLESNITDETEDELGSAAYSPPQFRLPQQDIDRAGAKNDKTIVEDLAEAKMKIHDLTLQLFNDQTYSIKDPRSVYFGQSQSRRRSSRKADDDVAKQLDKLLNLGEYSSSNMIVTRVSPYVEPIVGSVNSFLCLFRALYNILTWKDPFLSFWVCVLGAVLAFILFIFPWRLLLFVAGVVLVGPQNLVIRIVREQRQESRSKIDEAAKDKPNADDQPSTEGDSDEERKFSELTEEEIEEPALPEDQLIFKGHGEPNQKQKELDPKDVNPRELHHVVVPYSQLKYQRMYDWPPEPQYANVKIPPKQPPAVPGPPTLKSMYAAGSSDERLVSPVVRRRTRTNSREFSLSEGASRTRTFSMGKDE